MARKGPLKVASLVGGILDFDEDFWYWCLLFQSTQHTVKKYYVNQQLLGIKMHFTKRMGKRARTIQCFQS